MWRFDVTGISLEEVAMILAEFECEIEFKTFWVDIKKRASFELPGYVIFKNESDYLFAKLKWPAP